MIREPRGFERLRIALTGKRTYNCCDCDLVFHARERRRSVRGSDDEEAGGSAPDSDGPAQSAMTIEDAARELAGLIQDTTLSGNKLADRASEFAVRSSQGLSGADFTKLTDAFMMTSRILGKEVSRRKK
jgi:hypothetical protein